MRPTIGNPLTYPPHHPSTPLHFIRDPSFHPTLPSIQPASQQRHRNKQNHPRQPTRLSRRSTPSISWYSDVTQSASTRWYCSIACTACSRWVPIPVLSFLFCEKLSSLEARNRSLKPNLHFCMCLATPTLSLIPSASFLREHWLHRGLAWTNSALCLPSITRISDYCSGRRFQVSPGSRNTTRERERNTRSGDRGPGKQYRKCRC